MGRRALKRIDRNLELSSYLFELEDVPRPCTSAALFGREAPLEVEVGSGKGLFMRRAAVARPEHCFLGIEIARKYTRFAAANLARRELTNAKMVIGDGLRLFDEYLPDGSLEAVHVYFPDPWWKKRHRKRRVMRESFVRRVEQVLRPGGWLHFWTDVREYFDETLDLLARATSLDGPHAVPESPAEDDLDYRTHFERRMRLADEPVYRSQFRRLASAESD